MSAMKKRKGYGKPKSKRKGCKVVSMKTGKNTKKSKKV